MFAKAEFTNLNFTKKVRILFVESQIRSGSGLAKAESIFHKILDRSKKNVGGDNLWSRSTKFENIVEFVIFNLWNPTIFLGPTNFCRIGFVNSAFANTLFTNKTEQTSLTPLYAQTF